MKHLSASDATPLYTLGELAERVQAACVGDAALPIRGAAAFESAGSHDIALAGSTRYLKTLDQCGAGALVVPESFTCEERNLLRAANPQASFARVMALFHRPARPEALIHPTAVVADGVRIGSEAAIAAHVVIGRGAVLGERVILHPNVVLGEGVVLGDDVEVHPNASILAGCRIGSRVVIQSGAVIGSDGFGFAPDGDGYVKIPHMGTVVIEDDVEIGACTAIDRAKFGETRIGRGVKTDNLVHIAHNVTVGDNTVVVAQVGISGSVQIGRHAVLAGQAGVSQHLRIGDGAILGPQCGVAKSVPDGQIVSGSPELPHRTWLRVQRVVPRLPEMKRALDRIEKRLQQLERSAGKRDEKDGNSV